MWLFLYTSKSSPLIITKLIIPNFKSQNPHRTVKIDQGQEPGDYIAFKDLILTEDFQFSIELTEADTSA